MKWSNHDSIDINQICELSWVKHIAKLLLGCTALQDAILWRSSLTKVKKTE